MANKNEAMVNNLCRLIEKRQLGYEWMRQLLGALKSADRNETTFAEVMTPQVKGKRINVSS